MLCKGVKQKSGASFLLGAFTRFKEIPNLADEHGETFENNSMYALGEQGCMAPFSQLGGAIASFFN